MLIKNGHPKPSSSNPIRFSLRIIFAIALLLLAVTMPTTDLFGQNSSTFIQISGEVRSSETQEPLEFVRVQLVGTDIVTLTDKLGKFSLNSPQTIEIILRFSMIGYKSVDTKASEYLGYPNNINIYLDPSVSLIDEVVITSSPTGSGVQYQPAQAFNQAEITQRKDVTVGHMLDGEPGLRCVLLDQRHHVRLSGDSMENES